MAGRLGLWLQHGRGMPPRFPCPSGCPSNMLWIVLRASRPARPAARRQVAAVAVEEKEEALPSFMQPPPTVRAAAVLAAGAARPARMQRRAPACIRSAVHAAPFLTMTMPLARRACRCAPAALRQATATKSSCRWAVPPPSLTCVSSAACLPSRAPHLPARPASTRVHSLLVAVASTQLNTSWSCPAPSLFGPPGLQLGVLQGAVVQEAGQPGGRDRRGRLHRHLVPARQRLGQPAGAATVRGGGAGRGGAWYLCLPHCLPCPFFSPILSTSGSTQQTHACARAPLRLPAPSNTHPSHHPTPPFRPAKTGLPAP